MIKSIESLAYQDIGFSAFYQEPCPPSGHTHDTFEISVFEGGTVTMLYGGQPMVVAPECLMLHWGMLPHQMLERDAAARVVGVHVPLTWVLEWSIPGTLLSRLLNMELIIEPRRSQPCSDLALMKDWFHLLETDRERATEVVQAEVRARLLRMALRPASEAPSPSDGLLPPAPQPFRRALSFIIHHFREPLRLRDIAAEAGISPRHLTRTFSEYTGQTVNAYMTHLRLSHAQRLLATTDRTILDIMHASGFSCPTQFYRMFREQTGSSPKRFRTR